VQRVVYLWRECGEREAALIGFAMGECAGAEDEGAVCDSFGEVLCTLGVLEKTFGLDCGPGFSPVRLIRRDNREMREAEVGHGARDGANVERVARADEDDLDVVALGSGEQEMIVDRGRLQADAAKRRRC
jgi:hypothetical protein